MISRVGERIRRRDVTRPARNANGFKQPTQIASRALVEVKVTITGFTGTRELSLQALQFHRQCCGTANDRALSSGGILDAPQINEVHADDVFGASSPGIVFGTPGKSCVPLVTRDRCRAGTDTPRCRDTAGTGVVVSSDASRGIWISVLL